MTDDQPMLPGLEPPGSGQEPAMVQAARRTLAALVRDDVLDLDRSAVLVALVLELAQAVASGSRSGRASATAMAAAQLRETMLVLDPPPEAANAADSRAALARFVADLEAHANGQEVPR